MAGIKLSLERTWIMLDLTNQAKCANTAHKNCYFQLRFMNL